jgi:hypothetical protein
MYSRITDMPADTPASEYTLFREHPLLHVPRIASVREIARNHVERRRCRWKRVSVLVVRYVRETSTRLWAVEKRR